MKSERLSLSLETGNRSLHLGLILILTTSILCGRGQAATVVYSTGFEPNQDKGYRTDLDLAGQSDWIGTTGNGIVTNFFQGYGQQAYIGHWAPPGDTNEFYVVYRPVNLAPIPTNEPLVKFSVMMQIIDSSSTNGPFDDFRWSIYNTNGTRLFSVVFDNAALQISYLLEDSANFISTGVQFDTLGYYDLVIAMNFARNVWSATLNDLVIINGQPITTLGSPLNLGDVDAVWGVAIPGSPGDNYMLFDNYTITTEALASIPPRLEFSGFGAGGTYKAWLYGEPGLTYQVEASTDLKQWSLLQAFTAPTPGGVLEFQDPSASTFGHRFYRARQVP